MTPEEVGDYRKLLRGIIENAEEKLSELPYVALPWESTIWKTYLYRAAYEGGATYAEVYRINEKWYYRLPYLEWYDAQHEVTRGQFGSVAESKEDAMFRADTELKKRRILLMETR